MSQRPPLASPRRRGLLEAAALAAASILAPPLLAAPTKETFGAIPVQLREGTNLAIALSPDRSTLAMDLQGILWILPVAGGAATRLTGDLDDIAHPDWAPDGRDIVFQSYRDGNFHLWSIGADGSSLRQITSGLYDCREPRHSPDGRQIAFACDRGGSYGIYALDLASGVIRCVIDSPGEDGEPAWSPDGSQIAFSSNGKIAAVPSAGATPAQIRILFDGPGASAPAWTMDGGAILCRVASGTPRDMRTSRLHGPDGPLSGAEEEVFPFAVAWLSADTFLYTADGLIKRRSLRTGPLGTIPFSATVHVSRADPRRLRQRDFDSNAPRAVKGISFPVLAPQADRIAFTALNQLWLLRIGDPVPRQLTHDSYAKIYPAWSADGQWLAYSCDRGGKFDIWLRHIDSGVERQLTQAPGALKQSSWSPDGTTIACACQDGYVNLVSFASGAIRRVMRQLSWAGRPTWSPDGKTIAFAAVKPFSSRYREGISAILTVDLASGVTRYHSPEPGVSLDVRNVNGPIWSPAGTGMAYTMRGTLWHSPVDAQGAPSGPPRQLSRESADAISWSGDGGKILYLSNARLRLLTLADGRIEDIPMKLSWNLAKPQATTVVHAGRMWDGQAETLRVDVDIVIGGNRIVAIEPHRPRRDVEWVDASALTVMPGLIDMHTHREMGNQFGDREPRIFLSYGVTTTRGLSDNPYLMLENRESVDAGARIGPRHFGTGDALDGSRVFYDGMRSITSMEHLELELERARALDYDLLKCYVRLAPAYQRRATEFAHRHGMAITAHYLFPAAAFGADGYEHMGGTSRFGYSRTGSALGIMYQDVLALSAAGGGFRTPTLFGLEPMLGDTPELVLADPRVTVLFPAWERAALVRAANGGPSKPVAAVANQVKAIKQMVRAGVQVVTGSDYPIVAPGLSMHLNLRAMVRYGMRPVDALRSATSVPGRVLQQDVGSIAVGKLADLAFVDGDPLTDIAAAANVRSVMVGGMMHAVEELIAPFRGREEGAVTVAEHEHAHAEPAALVARYQSADGHWWHDPHWVEEVRASCCLPA